MVTMAQRAVNWRNTHTHVDRTHSLTHLHQHSYNHAVRSSSSAITEFGIKFFILRHKADVKSTGHFKTRNSIWRFDSDLLDTYGMIRLVPRPLPLRWSVGLSKTCTWHLHWWCLFQEARGTPSTPPPTVLTTTGQWQHPAYKQKWTRWLTGRSNHTTITKKLTQLYKSKNIIPKLSCPSDTNPKSCCSPH